MDKEDVAGAAVCDAADEMDSEIGPSVSEASAASSSSTGSSSRLAAACMEVEDERAELCKRMFWTWSKPS